MLFSFVILSLGSSLMVALASILFWFFSTSAKTILDLKTLMALIFSSLFYVWSMNGHVYWASFQKTHIQERIILVSRFVLISMLGAFYFWGSHDITLFLIGYSLILFLGSAFEIVFLLKMVKPSHEPLTSIEYFNIFKNSFWPHLDYLMFNAFPLALIILAGKYVNASSLGRINFVIQSINFIFLFSTTASIRVNMYVSAVGFRAKISQLKKLMMATFAISLVAAFSAWVILLIVFKKGFLITFLGVENLFLYAILSIPGYMVYQFSSPILLELGLIRKSALLNTVNFLFFVALSFYVLPRYREFGAIILFSSFHLGLLFTQGMVFFNYRDGLKNQS